MTVENSNTDALACPSCGQYIPITDTADSAYFGCTQCHSFFSAIQDNQPVVIKQFSESSSVSPVIPIGQQCYFDKCNFTVTGFVVKYDERGAVQWVEYMLFNPELDYYYVLAHQGRNWYMIWRSNRQDFTVMNTAVNFDAWVAMQTNPYRKYDHYTSYLFDIHYAAGEFDYNILDEERVLQVEEYVDDIGELLVSEMMNGETTWYRGRQLTLLELKNAFGENYPPEFEDIDAIEKKFAYIFCGMVLVVQLLLSVVKQPVELMNAAYATKSDSTSWGKLNAINFGEIAINGPASLEFDLAADVDNEWLELAVSMVNKETGESYEFTKVVEYYHGYEAGESWSEGSKSADAVLSKIPTGNYLINVFPYGENAKEFTVQMQITQNTVLYSNILLAMAIIACYPFLKYWLKNLRNTAFDI